jgi:ubiquinone biosynthesis monooxygenase Coq7
MHFPPFKHFSRQIPNNNINTIFYFFFQNKMISAKRFFGFQSQARLYSTQFQQKKLQAIRDRMIRVDHAGEYGANRIYAGQMAILGNTKSGPLIKHMWDQEKEHLRVFEQLIPKYRTRPTAMLPFWNVAGYVLGAGNSFVIFDMNESKTLLHFIGTALLGEKAAMACTVAVESAITEHYNNQIRELMSNNLEENKELIDYIQKFRDEEQEHHDTGLAQGAEQTPGYNVLSNAIKSGCKAAIWISERV